MAVPPRWPLQWARGLATAHALLALDQAALAGGFLSGYYGALQMHAAGATYTALAALGFTIVAVFYWRRSGGPGWPAVAGAVLVVAEGVQSALGFYRLLAVHIPLGTSIIALGAVLVFWAWREKHADGDNR